MTDSVKLLPAVTVGSADEAKLLVVMLHGYGMRAEDFVPFAISLKVPAMFHFLQAPCEIPSGGYAWWRRELHQLAQRGASPWDLTGEYPLGRVAARAAVVDYLRRLEPVRKGRPILLIGFSQGGMLACDVALHEQMKLNGLALLSASRMAFSEWKPHLWRLEGMPCLISHGKRDPILAFSAGEALYLSLKNAHAKAQWVPFDAGHEIPLLVWRRLRRFMLEFC